MDITEKVATSLYHDVFSLMDHYVETFKSTDKKNDVFTFAKEIFDNCTEKEKILFLGFLKIILTDSASMILGALDGSGGNILETCEDIDMFCDGKKVEPWLNELFLEMVENSYETKKRTS